jgi:hypothetical protein
MPARASNSDVSTLADWVGACSATLAPLIELIRRHVLAAERLHGDDTTVPVPAKNKTVTGRLVRCGGRAGGWVQPLVDPLGFVPVLTVPRCRD